MQIATSHQQSVRQRRTLVFGAIWHSRSLGALLPLLGSRPLADENRRFHSLTDLLSIEQAICDRGVGVDSAVAEEWPVAADVFESLQVDVAHEDFFAVVRGFG